MIRQHSKERAEELSRDAIEAVGSNPISFIRIESAPRGLDRGMGIIVNSPFLRQSDTKGSIRSAMRMIEEAIRVTNEEFDSEPEVKLARVEFQVGHSAVSLHAQAHFTKEGREFESGTINFLHCALVRQGATSICEGTGHTKEAFAVSFVAPIWSAAHRLPRITAEGTRAAVGRKQEVPL
ncbi:MAG TPA: hypothetical protein VL944_01115 [Candidatus Acidoferrum sp.]|nr:hypothetical protein [Candidatus Acidoferrum sp.]